MQYKTPQTISRKSPSALPSPWHAAMPWPFPFVPFRVHPSERAAKYEDNNFYNPAIVRLPADIASSGSSAQTASETSTEQPFEFIEESLVSYHGTEYQTSSEDFRVVKNFMPPWFRPASASAKLRQNTDELCELKLTEDVTLRAIPSPGTVNVARCESALITPAAGEVEGGVDQWGRQLYDAVTTGMRPSLICIICAGFYYLNCWVCLTIGLIGGNSYWG